MVLPPPSLPPPILCVLHFPRKRLPHLQWKGSQCRAGDRAGGAQGVGRGTSWSQPCGRRPGHVTEPAADAVLSPGHFSISLQAAGSIYSSSSALTQAQAELLLMEIPSVSGNQVAFKLPTINQLIVLLVQRE